MLFWSQASARAISWYSGSFWGVFLLLHPDLCCSTVAIDGNGRILFLQQCERMNDGKKLADVVRALHGTEVEDLLSCGEINATIFHWPGISTASCIHSNGIRRHLQWKRKNSVVAVVWWIL